MTKPVMYSKIRISFFDVRSDLQVDRKTNGEDIRIVIEDLTHDYPCEVHRGPLPEVDLIITTGAVTVTSSKRS